MSYESVVLKIAELALSRSDLSASLEFDGSAPEADPGREMLNVGDGSDQQPRAVLLREEDLLGFGPNHGVPALSGLDGGQTDGGSAS